MLRFISNLTSLLLVVGAATVSRAEVLDVYVLTGQSNSLGTTFGEGSTAAQYGPGTDSADAATRFFWSNVFSGGYPPVLYGDSAGAITTLQVQQGRGVDPEFWGPEFGFARTMSAAGDANVLVIKASRGGGGNTFWDRAAFDANPGSGHMWGQLRDTVDAALNAAQAAGHQVRVRGLLYLQGESNDSSEASLADERLSELSDNLRQHINTNFSGAASDMNTVVGEIAASASNSSRIMTTKLQRALADRRDDMTFIQTHDLPLKSDGLHFGRGAKLAIGQRFADALLDLQTRPDLVIARYASDLNPPPAVPHPSSLGWTEAGPTTGVTRTGVTEGGTRGWQIIDTAAGVIPGYFQPLFADDYRAMFDHGWIFRAKVKVVSGSGSALWSVTKDDAPAGWNIADGPGNLVGFEILRVGDDQFQVKLGANQDAMAINLGAGSADRFHTLELVGRPGLNAFDLLVDGQFRVTSSITSGTGSSGLEDRALFQAGRGAGHNVIWNEVTLQALPEPCAAKLLPPAMFVFAIRPPRKNG